MLTRRGLIACLSTTALAGVLEIRVGDNHVVDYLESGAASVVNGGSVTSGVGPNSKNHCVREVRVIDNHTGCPCAVKGEADIRRIQELTIRYQDARARVKSDVWLV
jgi:hypothetical protein